MKNIIKLKSLIFIILCIVLTSCVDKEEYQKCKTMRSETADLIAKADIIIKENQAKIDSINKIILEWVASSGGQHNSVSMWGLENAVNDVINVKVAISRINTYLGSIYFNYGIMAKASTRFGYLFKGKRKIIRMYTQIINEENSIINNITGGLTAKEYIYKYLPEKFK